MRHRQFAFWILTAAVFAALILPILIKDGMFLDGLLYTCVAKNLSDGIGTFINPIFSESWNLHGVNTFHEHPPLVFGIQSLFFKVLGNSMYVERFYSLLTGVVSAWIIALIWRTTNQTNNEIKQIAWLPVLFWITIPICYWSYQNNMQENTMGIFSSASVYFMIKALFSNRNKIILLIIAGVFIFLASFSKGIPGFATIGVIGIYWIVCRNISFFRTIGYTLILIAIPALLYGLICLDETVYESLKYYVNERLINRVEDAPTVKNRFYIFYRLLSEVIPAVLITLIFAAIFKWKKIENKLSNGYLKNAFLFFGIGIIGVVPYTLTLVQKGFYFVPILPFIGLGFAFLIAPGISYLITKIDLKGGRYKAFKITTVTLFVGTLVFSSMQIGKRSRDSDVLDDVYLIGGIVKENSALTITHSMSSSWGLKCYFVRYFNISLWPENNLKDYFLIEKKLDPIMLANYQILDLDTKVYDLYKRK